MQNLPIDVSKTCRTCFQSKNEVVSVLSVDLNSGIALNQMIFQVANIEVFQKMLFGLILF